MAELTLQEAAAAMTGDLRGEPRPAIVGYSIDSRTVQRGDLFFALVGERHDGHDFVDAALAGGACAAVVSNAMDVPEGGALIRVDDTTRALQELASHVRRREEMQVVGITGSAGKTTTKEMTAELLSGKFRTYRSEGNFNNLYGLPLTLLRMPAGTQVAVLEMGMSYAGELRRLAAIARPDTGVLTNVSAAHLVNFESVDEIAAAKEELFLEMGGHGTGIFNADDERCRGVAERFAGYTFTFGLEHAADLTAASVQADGPGGMRLVVRQGDSQWPMRIGLPGVHQVYNLLAALSVGYMLGCDMDWMVERAGALAAGDGRGRLRERSDGTRILDDSYNSNPAALRRAIATLVAAAPAGSRRVLFTGDMLELGNYAPAAHEEAGRVAGESRLELVVAVGPLSAETARTAREAGAGEVHHFEDSEAAAAAAAALVRAGDTVLVKGSRGIRMERIVERLLEPGLAVEGNDGS